MAHAPAESDIKHTDSVSLRLKLWDACLWCQIQLIPGQIVFL